MSTDVEFLAGIGRYIREGMVLVSQGEVRPGIVQDQHWACSIARQEADFRRTMATSSTALPRIISVTPYRLTPHSHADPRLSNPVER